jgi:hypothetical protein
MNITIPEYPEARPLQLTDKTLFQEQFHALQPQVSEFTFANLFLFRHIHRYTVTAVAGSLVVCGCGYDESPYFLPPLTGERGITTRRLLREGKTLYGADEQFVVEHLDGDALTVVEDRDNDDYLYSRSELAELPGKRFHKKKNRINYFAARHSYTVETFSRLHLESALLLLSEWQRVHQEDMNRSLAAEIAATREGLELAADLGLSGVVILTGGKVVAFALGEQLNADTAVCHFEKADPFLEGLAQLVNREFSRSQPANCSFINREQDLGESGLREAKLTYLPVGMVRKFRVTANG